MTLICEAYCGNFLVIVDLTTCRIEWFILSLWVQAGHTTYYIYKQYNNNIGPPNWYM